MGSSIPDEYVDPPSRQLELLRAKGCLCGNRLMAAR
jgi:hypothetical protein